MTDQQAKYGAIPDEVSKTAQSNPGSYQPKPREDKDVKEAPKGGDTK